jgi:hypothetical protein
MAIELQKINIKVLIDSTFLHFPVLDCPLWHLSQNNFNFIILFHLSNCGSTISEDSLAISISIFFFFHINDDRKKIDKKQKSIQISNSNKSLEIAISPLNDNLEKHLSDNFPPKKKDSKST